MGGDPRKERRGQKLGNYLSSVVSEVGVAGLQGLLCTADYQSSGTTVLCVLLCYGILVVAAVVRSVSTAADIYRVYVMPKSATKSYLSPH